MEVIMSKKTLLLTLALLFSTTYIYAQEQKTIAAVMDLQVGEGISQSVCSTLSDYLRAQLFNTQKFAIVTRENMEQILKEQQFQLSGCTSNECVVQAGQLLGVSKIFTGSLGKVGTTYVITLKLINVESGKAERVETEKCAQCKEETLLISMENIANKIAKIEPKSGAVSEVIQLVQIETKEISLEDDSPVMVLIPAGEFLMGSPEGEGEADEHPQHKVYLDAYYIDKYEVTNEQYAKFLNEWGKDTDENGQKMIYEHDWGVKKISGWFESPQKWQPAKGYEKYPVNNVNWYGANQYAKWAGKRLPTEAEWEKACRASSTTTYYYGNDESELGEYAWYIENSGAKTHPVGTMKPNQWGIYDMYGNVWEWCSDWYYENYYSDSPPKNPQGPFSGNVCVVRGGSWLSGTVSCWSAGRDRLVPDGKWYYRYGFRCAASPK